MLRAGLVGLPSAGKSTLFQLLTSVHEAARPHGKIEAHVGVSRVPDSRLDRLTELFQPKRRVPATVEFADLAAGRGEVRTLVDTAAYRNADALLHVLRAFRDPGVPHSHTTVHPVRDARLIEDELILADLAIAERRLDRLAKDLKKGASVDLKHEQDVLARCKSALEEGQALRTIGLTGEDAKRVRGFQFLSAKPLLVVINLDEADMVRSDEAVAALGLSAHLQAANAAAVVVCARIELEIAQLAPDDARAFLADLGLAESGLDRVIRAAYELLGYISFFTVGDDECRAWSIPRDTAAHDAAGAIHTDIQRGFIRAEVVPWDTLVARGSLAACRDHGELRLEGKDYLVADGDVITFRFAT